MLARSHSAAVGVCVLVRAVAAVKVFTIPFWGFIADLMRNKKLIQLICLICSTSILMLFAFDRYSLTRETPHSTNWMVTATACAWKGSFLFCARHFMLSYVVVAASRLLSIVSC